MNIPIIQGHPDASVPHFCHALAEAFARAAKDAGHEVRMLDVARSEAQEAIRWAAHL